MLVNIRDDGFSKPFLHTVAALRPFRQTIIACFICISKCMVYLHHLNHECTFGPEIKSSAALIRVRDFVKTGMFALS